MKKDIKTTKHAINEIIGRCLDDIKKETGLTLDAKINNRTINFYADPDQENKIFDLADIESVMVNCLNLDDKKSILKAKDRRRDFADLRTIFSYIARKYNFTVTSIGKYMEKDHTTAIHHFRKAEDLLKTDPVFLEKYTKVVNSLNEKYATFVY